MPTSHRNKKEKHIFFERPKIEDGIYLYTLVSQCPPLDLNSKYAYFLIASHFSETSVIARDKQNGTPIGMTSGYLLPENPNILFIWQTALLANYRGKGIAKKMVDHILMRENLNHVNCIHTTISPSNRASQNLFQSIAKTYGAPMQKESFLSQKDFEPLKSDYTTSSQTPLKHEKEILYKIGPLNKKPQNQNSNTNLRSIK